MSPARCRACGSAGLQPVFSLGRMPLANALLAEDELHRPEPVYPLELAFCPACTLLQILETVPPEVLFRDYPYFSSFSDTMLEHARQLSAEITRRRQLNEDSLVVEIASNDGYLLQYFRARGIPVLGIEPAANVARAAVQERGVPTLVEFFDQGLAGRLAAQGNRADLVLALNVLAHVPDLTGFLQGLRVLLKPGGLAVIEVPYARTMVERCEFDTIYHEHLCYFSVTALHRACSSQGLRIEAVESLPIHGGSLRLFLTVEEGPSTPRPALAALLAEEAAWGVAELETYRAFARRAAGVRSRLLDLLARLKSAGHRLAAYGAAAKGASLLNYCGLGPETLDFVVDRSPYKQGHYLPGARLPILPPERLLEARPAYVLLLAWNLAPEILAQQTAYRLAGGRFILPLPEPGII